MKIKMYRGTTFEDAMEFKLKNPGGERFFTSNKKRAEGYARDYSDGMLIEIEFNFKYLNKNQKEFIQNRVDNSFFDMVITNKHKNYKYIKESWCRKPKLDVV